MTRLLPPSIDCRRCDRGSAVRTVLTVLTSLLLTFLLLTGSVATRPLQSAEVVSTVSTEGVVPTKVVQAGTTGDPQDFRKILVSATVNTPEPFQGFGGYCGWPDVCRLKNGDLFVTFGAGYNHASWPTPLDMPPEEITRWKKGKHAWSLDWDCPEGGRIMWIRSRDQGKTWTRPKAFPVVPGAYSPGDVIQLGDGTMLATATIQDSWGYWKKMPSTPLEFARITANRLPSENVIYRSEDNGESWQEVGRHSFFGHVDAVYTLLQRPDGSVIAIFNFSPIPGGPGWPQPADLFWDTRWLTATAVSHDQGETWSILSVTGSNEFDSTEATGGYLPDGSIGFMVRQTSHWFRSLDNGETWSSPGKIFAGGTTVHVKRGSLQVTPEGVVALVYCADTGGILRRYGREWTRGNGQVIYSRDNGQTWIKPAEDHGFQYDPLAYYPDACVLEDGTIFAVGNDETYGKENEFGPRGADVTSMRFRIKSPQEGEGIELLPVGGPAVPRRLDLNRR